MTIGRSITLLVITLFMNVALSHHAQAPVYDGTRTVTINGIVTEFRFINPHAMMAIEVTDDSGTKEVWAIELAGRLSLSRDGWSDDSVAVDEHVTITGHPMHSGANGLWLTRIVLGDGSELLGPREATQNAIEEQRRLRAQERTEHN
jgi:hypothetical protein